MSNADWRYEGVSFLFVSLFRAVVTRLCLCGTEAGLIPNDGVPLLFIEDATDGVTSIYFATRSQHLACVHFHASLIEGSSLVEKFANATEGRTSLGPVVDKSKEEGLSFGDYADIATGMILTDLRGF
jgi:hypothetical protein